MANLTNFSFEFFYETFTEDASLLFLYHGAKKSKMTKNSNEGGLEKGAEITIEQVHFSVDARLESSKGKIEG